MVMRLPSPDLDHDTFIDTVVEQREKGRNASFFTNVKNEWKQRVQLYLQARGDPSIIKPWTAVTPHSEKFKNLYLNPSENSIQRPMLDSLRSRELQLCPACGENGTPNTLDHYLPKDSYPEFSITAINLFPMCDICQGHKKTATVDETNQRLFLHPYFDEFLDIQALSLQIGHPYEAPASMTITPHPALEHAQQALVSRHLDHLAVSTRYHRYFKSEYLRLLRLVSNLRNTGQNVTVNLENFRNYARNKSINSWDHIFYDGVLADPTLMQYLCQGQLPAQL